MTSSNCVFRRGTYAFCVSAIDLNSRTPRNTHLASVIHELEPDPGRLAVLGVGQRDIRQMDRGLFRDDAAFLLRRLLLVALHHVDTANKRTTLGRAYLDHLAGTTPVASGQDNN